MSCGYSKFKTQDMQTTVFPIWKTTLLLILGGLALFVAIYGKMIHRYAEQIAAVTSTGEDKLGATVVCPICRHRFANDEFVADSVPNMRNCPYCNRKIPLPYLIRQRIK